MALLLCLLALILLLLLSELYPIKRVEFENCKEPKGLFPFKNSESFALHLHTFFSYDSLGKPEELEMAALSEGLSKVFVTDHDNDDLSKVYSGSLLVTGKEYQHPELGRVLSLPGGITVIAHPNGVKKEYSWRGVVGEDLYYELVDLKDVLYNAPLWAKLLVVFRFLFLRPLRGRKEICFFSRLVPLKKWLSLYIRRTGGKMPIVGGLDHHVKVTLWEKGKRYLSFPPYGWSLKLLRNTTFGVEASKALKDGLFYISFCGDTLLTDGVFVKPYPEGKFFVENHYGSGKTKVNLCGKVDKGSLAVAVYRYRFRLGKLFFGVRPSAVFLTDRFLKTTGGG